MSYTILYKKVALELSDGRIFPLVLCGSNNCTESVWRNGKYYERRERSWAPALWFHNKELKKRLLFTKEEYINAVKADIEQQVRELDESRGTKDSPITMKSYEYYGLRIGSKSATYASEQSYFVNMAKNAVLLEEFLKRNTLYCRIDVVDWSSDKRNKDKESRNSFYIHSEQDLLNMDEYYQKQYVFAKEHGMECYCVPDLSEELILPKKERIPKAEYSGPKFVIKFKSAYIVRMGKNKVRLSYSPNTAKYFVTEKSACKWLEKYDSKLHGAVVESYTF